VILTCLSANSAAGRAGRVLDVVSVGENHDVTVHGASPSASPHAKMRGYPALEVPMTMKEVVDDDPAHSHADRPELPERHHDDTKYDGGRETELIERQRIKHLQGKSPNMPRALKRF
jgi:hypothetical protein